MYAVIIYDSYKYIIVIYIVQSIQLHNWEINKKNTKIPKNTKIINIYSILPF